jgi:polar amino acid transport system substrate-binding protein
MTNKRKFILGTTSTAPYVSMLVVAGVLAAGIPDAKAESTLERVKAAGVVKVGVGFEPPYTEFSPGGEFTGPAADITRLIMKKLGVAKVDAQRIDWGAVIPGLQSRRFDMIPTVLNMSPKRCQAMLYSQPELCSTRAFAVIKGNPKKLTTMESIRDSKDATLAVCGGCFEDIRAREIGVPKDRIVIVSDVLNALEMVKSGRVDAYGSTFVTVAAVLAKTNDPQIELVEASGLPAQCTGAGFRPEDKEFRDAYDTALQEIKNSGEFDKIVAPWRFNAEYAKTHTRDDFCGGPN